MNGEISDLYSQLSKVLQYPDAEYRSSVDIGLNLIAELHPELKDSYQHFSESIRNMSDEEIEENYVRTFDVQSVCCLDVGYAMFGEDYKRGQFMAELKVLYAESGLKLGCEMPDFLPYLLNLVTKIKFGNSTDLVEVAMVPGVQKMLESFGESKNHYRVVLEIIDAILRKDFSIH